MMDDPFLPLFTAFFPSGFGSELNQASRVTNYGISGATPSNFHVVSKGLSEQSRAIVSLGKWAGSERRHNQLALLPIPTATWPKREEEKVQLGNDLY